MKKNIEAIATAKNRIVTHLTEKLGVVSEYAIESLEDIILKTANPEFAGSFADARRDLIAGNFDNFMYLKGPDLFMGDLATGSHECCLSLLADLLEAERLDESWDGFGVYGHRESRDRAFEFLVSGGGY